MCTSEHDSLDGPSPKKHAWLLKCVQLEHVVLSCMLLQDTACFGNRLYIPACCQGLHLRPCINFASVLTREPAVGRQPL